MLLGGVEGDVDGETNCFGYCLDQVMVIGVRPGGATEWPAYSCMNDSCSFMIIS